MNFCDIVHTLYGTINTSYNYSMFVSIILRIRVNFTTILNFMIFYQWIQGLQSSHKSYQPTIHSTSLSSVIQIVKYIYSNKRKKKCNLKPHRKRRYNSEMKSAKVCNILKRLLIRFQRLKIQNGSPRKPVI